MLDSQIELLRDIKMHVKLYDKAEIPLNLYYRIEKYISAPGNFMSDYHEKELERLKKKMGYDKYHKMLIG